DLAVAVLITDEIHDTHSTLAEPFEDLLAQTNSMPWSISNYSQKKNPNGKNETCNRGGYLVLK
ncbi:MAG: hypothetical protein H6Q04_2780, partial [Acidobacteria bacterium]|nr:hypothetical protein [Acidobacteriota bacterium]